MLHDTTLYRTIYLVYFLHFLSGVQEKGNVAWRMLGCACMDVCVVWPFARGKGVWKWKSWNTISLMFMIGKPPWVWSAQRMEPRSKSTSEKDSALGGAQGAQGRLHCGRYLSDAQIRTVTSWLSFTRAADDHQTSSTLVVVTSSHLKGRVNPDPVPAHQG